MEKFLSLLKQIKKEELTEREFYEDVLSVIAKMKGVSLTPESAEQLKKTLQEIGCVPYDEWKKEKDEKGERILGNTIGEAFKNGYISGAVSCVSQLLSSYKNASFALPFMLDGRVQEWLLNSTRRYPSKRNIPYYKVAKQALMNWNGLSENEANKVIKTQNFDEIESQVYAKGSMDYAVEGIKKSLGLSDQESEALKAFIYTGDHSSVIDYWRRKIELEKGQYGEIHARENKEMFNNLIMDTLFHVHDGWVKDNKKKFNAREKKHQHMPSELIGWREAKADLLFIRPIFEAANIEVNEDELEKLYNRRVKKFFLERNIQNASDLVQAITQGEEFYPALEDYGEVLTDIKQPEFVETRIIPAIEEQGIGNIEEVRRRIVSEVISNPEPEDVARLSEEEKGEVERALSEEVTELTEERDEMHEKNSTVQKILALAIRRKAIKEEIAKATRSKDENTHSINE